MCYYVYIHICPNGKRYIGATKDYKKRWAGKGQNYRSTKFFYNAIKEFGFDNIKHIIIENENESLMYFWERILIRHYNTNDINYGYNYCSGGRGTKGLKHTNESRKKMSINHSGGMKVGWKPTDEMRLKISIAAKNRKRKGKNTWIKGRVAWNKGLKTGSRSEEVKRKISETLKNRKRKGI